MVRRTKNQSFFGAPKAHTKNCAFLRRFTLQYRVSIASARGAIEILGSFVGRQHMTSLFSNSAIHGWPLFWIRTLQVHIGVGSHIGYLGTHLTRKFFHFDHWSDHKSEMSPSPGIWKMDGPPLEKFLPTPLIVSGIISLHTSHCLEKRLNAISCIEFCDIWSVCTPDPPQNITIDVPRNNEVGASYFCTADANPPVISYVWTLVSSGEVLSMRQTLTLTEDLAIGQFE